MNYHETLEVVNQLKSIDLKNATNDEIKVLLRTIVAIPLPVVFLNKGVKIIRCRTVSVSKEEFVQNRIYCTYAEFSNPKRKKFFSIGRANSEDTTVFYGGIQSKVMNGFNTAVFELVPTTKSEEKDKELDFKRFDIVTGIWEVQKKMPFVILGSLNEDYMNLNEVGRQRINMLKNFMEENPKHSDVIRLVDEFLGKEFSKNVKRTEAYNYKISANYVDLLQGIKSFKGVIYPSTKALGAGINVAIFPKAVRNNQMKLTTGLYSVFYNRDNNCVNEYPMVGTYIDGKIRWKDKPNGKLSLMMRNYYTGRTDNDDFKRYFPMLDLGKPIETQD